MATFAAAYPSKPSWQLQLDVWETDLQPWANQSYVNWALYMYRGNGDTPWNNSGSGWAIAAPGYVEGSFGAYRFGSSGTGANLSGTPVGGRVLIASGGQWVGRNPDGSGSFQASAWHAAGSTLGTASIAPAWFTLATLRQAPGVPTGVGLAYVSDSQVSASWVNNFASNGAPTVNSVDRSVNNGGWVRVADISPASSLVIGAAANQKIQVRVHAANEVGGSGWSAASGAVFTTPAAPTGVTAVKDANQDIVISLTDMVAFAEHRHRVQHGTVTGGVITWGADVGTIPAGSTSIKHVAPDPSKVHVYAVRSENLDTGGRFSAWVQSNQVQLLAAPAKPTLANLGTYRDAAVDLPVTWAHNPVDTTPQTAYEVQYSTNSGGSWSSTGKVVSAVSQDVVPGGGFAADVALTFRVRTWGQAASGGSDGTGASPWSDPQTVTFKTRPTVSILSPADGSEWAESGLAVALGFTQPEGASFVRATINLWHGGVIVEQVISTTLTAAAFTTRVADGESYALSAVVLDSNGLESDVATADFDVAYTLPVAAGVTVTYLREEGRAQLDLTFPAPGVGEEPAVFVSIFRTIDGLRETIATRYAVDGASMAFLDTTVGIRNENVYTVRTHSDDGAAVDVEESLVTAEPARAFLSTGPGFQVAVSFRANLRVASAPARSSALVVTAGRRLPIAMFGDARSLDVSGSAMLSPGLGASPQEVETFILDAGVVCYRDPTGRRVFGVLSGSLSSPSSEVSQFQFKVSEVSV